MKYGFFLSSLTAVTGAVGLDIQIHRSSGGKALCYNTTLPLTVTARYAKVSRPVPKSQLELTDDVVAMTTNVTSLGMYIGGLETRTATHSIFSKLCVPLTQKEPVRTVQFLTHGATLDHSYWDTMPGFSYVDAAAAAGYATFSYDRLSIGHSDHPAAWDVQGPVQIELAHALIQRLRNGSIAGYAFENVIGVGHSLGSGITSAIAFNHNSDFDAIIVTGFAAVSQKSQSSIASWDSIMANQDASGRFKHLDNGYFTQGSKQALQYAFYKYPFFPSESKFRPGLSAPHLLLFFWRVRRKRKKSHKAEDQ